MPTEIRGDIFLPYPSLDRSSPDPALRLRLLKHAAAHSNPRCGSSSSSGGAALVVSHRRSIVEGVGRAQIQASSALVRRRATGRS
ncbi:hypothetical protein PR202_ga25749 [Eleusine coracana subsp. coracana]|uniref:Uncharacterized protein n=1 Tax=Eleusine coracana subsp. coracana TaxID=191504 RepID=A0AAV5DC64_ELECO|nr:hypothetical protein PR202_ga25749 [Eleusine coracana subsp. coracana]